jgi:hypothetical protein
MSTALRIAVRTRAQDSSIPEGKVRLKVTIVGRPEGGVLSTAVETLRRVMGPRVAKPHSAPARTRRIADRFHEAVRQIIMDATRAGQRALDPHAHGGADVDGVVAAALMAMVEEYKALPDVLKEVLVASGEATARAANAIGVKALAKKPAPVIKFSFNAKDARAAQWAKNHGAQMVVEIGKETRRAIASVITRAQTDGLTTRAQSRLIRPLVGLTERDANAVYNYRQELIARGLDEDVAADEAGAYADQLLDRRASNIARTETQTAANEGQSLAWDQAVEDGFLSPDAERKWIITDDDRLCEICEFMEGQQVGLDEPFVLEDGTEVDNPPAHPSCRCGMGIASSRARAASARDMSPADYRRAFERLKSFPEDYRRAIGRS